MFLTIFITILFFAAEFFSPENLISTGVGFLATLGLTQWIKTQSGLQGLGAMLLAFALSFVVSLAAFILATVMSGGELGWGMILSSGLQIFALATFTYRLMTENAGPPR